MKRPLLLRHLISAIAVSGGMSPALREMARILRREGARALVRKIRRLLASPSPEEPCVAGVEAAPPAARRTVRLIAFYLPQYHPIPENDQWWGTGFTEWTNVAKARPNFSGHYQPHLPAELGYYDLRDPGVRRRQAELAEAHGVHGFCYYYYWFNGKRLLNRPLDEMLASGEPAFPFCVCWANENWTRTWDGREHEVLIAQEYSAEDDDRFICSLLPLLADKRYIRVNGRPLLIVYKPALLPDARGTTARWREVCRRSGIGEIYLACVQNLNASAPVVDPRSLGFDAAVEFPPLGAGVPSATQPDGVVAEFKGRFYDYWRTALGFMSVAAPGFPYFRGVMPSWDNTARRQHAGHIYCGSDAGKYEQWLRYAIDWTVSHHDNGERLVFVNAWNEWGEGNHLEPDQKDGTAYLEATRRAIRGSDAA